MSNAKKSNSKDTSIQAVAKDPRFMRIVKAAQRKGGKSVLSDGEAYAAGLLALMDAAERFDSTKGEDFLAFAAKRITGQIMSDAKTFGVKIVSTIASAPKLERADLHRQLDARPDKKTAPLEYLAAAPQSPDPLMHYLTEEATAAVSTLLTNISTESRRILSLHLEHDNFADLAKVLGTDEMTARKKLRKATDEARNVATKDQKKKGAA